MAPIKKKANKKSNAVVKDYYKTDLFSKVEADGGGSKAAKSKKAKAMKAKANQMTEGRCYKGQAYGGQQEGQR